MLDILLVEDEPLLRMPLADAIRGAGYSLRVCSDGAEALAALDERVFDVVVTDLRLPKADGMQIFKKVRQVAPQTDVILMTAYGTVADAVGALKEGATDYLTKPFDVEHLLHRLAGLDRCRGLAKDLEAARTVLALRTRGPALIGKSPAFVRLLERIQTFGASDAPVLIVGESGTGKELVAKSLHEQSARHDKPFVAVNCAAFPETLLEAELFGHERGAFTGAVKKREGRFKAAHQGTLFLDEVAEMPLAAQAKLLRVLQEGTFEPLGTNTPVSVDVRVISATHRNLKDRIAQGLFREDLYYRLNVLQINIPPLRERRGDLPLLVEHFLRRFTPEGQNVPTVSPRAWAALSEYEFPGNVRELEHALQHACVLARGGEIDLSNLPSEMVGDVATAEKREEGTSLRPLSAAVREFEHAYLLRALKQTHGRKAEAAKLLGISRKNLWEKLRAYGGTNGHELEIEPREAET
ncbi:MAG TPA: sigma-54 dependent transcriptional regulator [bacterium]|nr:sigma-54 dependent transcriptional regulator [bacterium]